MALSQKFSGLSGRNGVLLGADIAYIIAFILISTRLSVGTLDVVLLVLALISLVLIGVTAMLSLKPVAARLIALVQVVIAAVLSVRYLIFFFSELQFFATLLLFGAVIAFAYVALSGILSLVRQMGGSDDGAGAQSTGGTPPPDAS